MRPIATRSASDNFALAGMSGISSSWPVSIRRLSAARRSAPLMCVSSCFSSPKGQKYVFRRKARSIDSVMAMGWNPGTWVSSLAGRGLMG